MDLKKRLSDIANFLQPYQRIWQNEIMLCYPTPFKDYPMDWTLELASIKNENDLIRLQKKDVEGLIQSQDLIHFYQKIKELENLPSAPEYPSASTDLFTFLYTTPKKEHEIRRLAPFINHLFQKNKCEHIIDIGGGVGLLAQHLANLYNLPVTSLDIDSKLQRTGENRYLENKRIPKNKVAYKNLKVESQSLSFRKFLKKNSLAVGLHTCGLLAIDQIKACSELKINSLINFGCCYHKLPTDGAGQNISRFAQELPQKITLNNYALTLATRGHVKMDGGDYTFKLKVKHYRYALHFLLHDLYDYKEMVNLGNSKPSLYEQDFATYAKEQLKRIHLQCLHTEAELNYYYKDQKIQDLIWNMLAASFLRDAMGRLLELYLLLDRAIYLEEQGYQAELNFFFDEELSPRNIGIIATM